MTIRTVFFDVGETLLNETRLWALWADALGVTHLTFFATLGVVIERGLDHRRVFPMVRPDLDVAELSNMQNQMHASTRLLRSDFYPDAVPCLESLRATGYRIGLAGNSSPAGEQSLRDLALPVDVIGGAGSWGFEKPHPKFFARLVDVSGCDPAEIVYVGDRIDNDVVPAAGAGMKAIFIRRGPWALAQQDRADVARASAVIDSLDQLPEAVAGLSS